MLTLLTIVRCTSNTTTEFFALQTFLHSKTWTRGAQCGATFSPECSRYSGALNHSVAAVLQVGTVDVMVCNAQQTQIQTWMV